MKAVLASLMLLAFCGALVASEPVAIKIRDLTNIEGVRENPLIGYGMVVGLTRTGDSQQTVFTTQTLANIMQRMGAQIPPLTARVANVAAVFVTASLPAFARPGTQLDVTVSSIGDAKSLEAACFSSPRSMARTDRFMPRLRAPSLLEGMPSAAPAQASR